MLQNMGLAHDKRLRFEIKGFAFVASHCLLFNNCIIMYLIGRVTTKRTIKFNKL